MDLDTTLTNATSEVRETVSLHITREGYETWLSAQIVWLGPLLRSGLVCIDKGSFDCLVGCGDEAPYR